MVGHARKKKELRTTVTMSAIVASASTASLVEILVPPCDRAALLTHNDVLNVHILMQVNTCAKVARKEDEQ